jgi:hypothetical protein
MKNTLKIFMIGLLVCGMAFTTSAQEKSNNALKKTKTEHFKPSNGDVEDFDEAENVKLLGIS